MATKKRPGVPTIPLDQKFVPIEYNGTRYSLRVELDLNSGSFLKVTEMRYGGVGGSNLVAYPTDDENAINAKPWGGPMSPTGGLGKSGTKLFNEVINSQEAKQAVASELSSLYGTVKPNIQEEWKKSANNAGTNDILSQIVPGSGSFEPNPQQPPLSTITPGPGEVIGGPIALPEDIKKLQDTADATIKSLGGDPSADYPIYFVYPTDAYYGNSQDSVLIEQFEYRAPQADVFAPNNQVNPTGLLQSLQTGLSRGSNIKRTIGGVRLPIPNQLAISNGVSWADDRANAVEAGAFFTGLGAAQQLLGGNMGGFANSILSGADKFIDALSGGAFSTGTSAGMLLSSFLAQYGLGKIGINVDPGQFIARATGATINPNLELLFNGPKLRNFSFAFEFAPNDEADATETRKIIRFFRQGMAPKKNNDNLIFIGSPNVFRVRYLNGSRRIKGLNSYKICALTACEVNFTPEGVYQSYDDERAVSQPVRTNMTLSFTELTPIFESDYFDDTDPSVVDAALGPFTPDDIGF